MAKEQTKQEFKLIPQIGGGKTLIFNPKTKETRLFSLIGEPITTGTKRKVTAVVPTQEDLKWWYDIGPEMRKHVQAPSGYKAPWDKS